MTGPLAGIRVMDMGHAGVGPYAGSILGQLGADVIKVEPPWGDIIQQAGTRRKNGMSTFYIGLNFNKRGIILDLKQAVDLEIYYDLIKTCDVYIDNWRDGAADRLGIGYDDLSSRNERVVYVNSSGFGSRGPWRTMGSYDHYGEMFSGLTSVTGAAGTRGERPRGGVRIDTQTSLCLIEMVLAGLWSREQTGKGQKIQGSQMESAVQLTSIPAFQQMTFGIDPAPSGSADPYMAPSQAFATADGYVAVTACDEREWRALCVALGRPDVVLDARFRTNAQRIAHREDLEAVLAPLFLERTSAEWIEALQGRGVPAGRFMNHVEQLDDPHIMGTGLLTRVQSQWGEMVLPPLPVRFTETPLTFEPGPLPGQHTEEVLAEVGRGSEFARPWVGPAKLLSQQRS